MATNGNPRLDRIEANLETLTLRVDQIAVRVDQIAVRVDQIGENVDKLARAMLALAEHAERTEERLNALIAVVDDLVRRTPPPLQT